MWLFPVDMVCFRSIDEWGVVTEDESNWVVLAGFFLCPGVTRQRHHNRHELPTGCQPWLCSGSSGYSLSLMEQDRIAHDRVHGSWSGYTKSRSVVLLGKYTTQTLLERSSDSPVLATPWREQLSRSMGVHETGTPCQQRIEVLETAIPCHPTKVSCKLLLSISKAVFSSRASTERCQSRLHNQSS